MIICARIAVCAAFALVVAACGGRPDPTAETAVTAEPTSFTWNLPVIDTAAGGADDEIYQALQKSCDDGSAMLDQKWQQTAGPRDVLVYAAGVAVCRNDVPLALTLYGQAKEAGWAGLGPAQDSARCTVYKAVSSVLLTAPAGSFPCPDGTGPAFVRSASGAIDDPRTPADESATTTAVPTPTTAPYTPPVTTTHHLPTTDKAPTPTKTATKTTTRTTTKKPTHTDTETTTTEPMEPVTTTTSSMPGSGKTTNPMKEEKKSTKND